MSQIGTAAALTITTTSLTPGTAGAAYVQWLNLTGGTPPYSWTGSALPAGLSIDSVSGVLSGTPAAAGNFEVTVTVVDSSPGSKQTASKSAALAISSLPGATVTVTSVNTAADFGGLPSFGSGSWLEIKGRGLAAGTRKWQPSDFNGESAPTSLDGTSVTVNGKPAFVSYISPTEIDVQAPADLAAGTVQIVVTSPAGTASFAAHKDALAPAMFAPASFNAGGKQNLAVQFDDGSYAGNVHLIKDVAFRPAKPGDTVIAYGMGFGDVIPEVVAGSITGPANAIPNLAIRIGETQAVTMYAGLAPGYVGLYQFSIVVPDVPDGDHKIEIEVGGVKVPQALYLTVQANPVLVWDFTNTTEGWTPVNMASSTVEGGLWMLDPAGADPHINGPPLYLPAAGFNAVQVRMQAKCSGTGSIYFKTAPTNLFSPDKKVDFDPTPSKTEFVTFTIPMDGNPQWKAGAVITAIRLDPCNTGVAGSDADSVIVDYIRLSRLP